MKYIAIILFLIFWVCKPQFTSLTLANKELNVVAINVCQSNQLYMNLTLFTTPANVDFITYTATNTVNCNSPGNLVIYYQSFSCIDVNFCNITRTATTIQSTLCYGFFNRYYKGPVIVNYILSTNCSQSNLQLSAISLTPSIISTYN